MAVTIFLRALTIQANPDNFAAPTIRAELLKLGHPTQCNQDGRQCQHKMAATKWPTAIKANIHKTNSTTKNI